MTHKRIVVRWIDSQQIEGWYPLEEINLQREPTVIETLGHLIAVNEHSLVVAASYGDRPPQVCATMAIPKRSVIGIHEVPPPAKFFTMEEWDGPHRATE